MTELIIENKKPPVEVQDDAKSIAEQDEAGSVHIEDAVDNQWFIRVTGSASNDGLGEERFERFTELVENLLEGEPSAYKTFYGIGDENERYLIRIEY